MPRRRHVLALLTLLAVVGCSGAPPAQEATTARPGSGAIRMAAVGDSITDADSPDLAGGVPGPQSWVSYAVGEDVAFVGGWAVWGARTEEMADAVGPVDADVLVILAGTNDAFGGAHSEIGANIARIAANAGVEQVVLSSVPPIDGSPASATDLNAFLEPFAAQQGWAWVDSAAGLRDGEVFADGMAYDGLHPTEAGARVIGEAIGEVVREVA